MMRLTSYIINVFVAGSITTSVVGDPVKGTTGIGWRWVSLPLNFVLS